MLCFCPCSHKTWQRVGATSNCLSVVLSRTRKDKALLLQPLKALLWPHSLGILAELPSSPSADTTRADPLVITVISVFIVMVGILGLVGFLRYRQHNNRMEFRRLQDLPMVSNALSPAWHGPACCWLLCSYPKHC